MQPTAAGSSSSSGGGGGGGGGELNRAGLARFRSAPATWLEALLEEEEEDPLKPNQCLTQLLSSGDPGLSQLDQVGFPRQNSSPADLLDGYFPNYGIPASYDYLSPNIDVSPSNKRVREDNTQFPSPKFHTQSKGEQSGQLPGAVSNLGDVEMEKLLEDSVPCRVRAKRGCATHPRSIAERVRRTRISDRIRKLQELVPNMDKQTNTADMLEEAVEYVKFLQRQIEELTEHQRRCKCAAKD
ncbi:Transcription factor bHLH80-like protein [Melia azedarach]|uniref:Transcription factor bHLH80-like protein n=1 Tax=Melia azedarach TaxID=155640 RepID=A0ACC1WQS7_MELAZ|nr:Transcription factor bHLH80-like protein [Melia azedarach]